MNRKRTGWLLSWIIAAVLVFAPAAFGAVQGQLYGFHPYITIQGEYSDNVALTEEHPTSDFITTVYPGLKYNTEGGGYTFELDYQMGLNFYASNSENNYISHQGSLNTYYSFNPRWTIRLTDSLIRSREGIESYTLTTWTGGQSQISSSSFENLYLRHIFEPALDYKFGQENLAALRYRNMIYRIVEGEGQDSTENLINPHLAYWFNIRNGVTLDYAFSTADFSKDPDWVGSDAAGSYFYRFNPRTKVFGTYAFSKRDLEAPGIDYSVHSLNVGMEHAFSSTLNLKAALGWFRQEIETGPAFEGPVYNLSMTQRSQRTNYALTLYGGFRESYFTSERLGFSRFNQAEANVLYKLRERLSVGLTGTLGRDEFHNPARTDLSWGLTGILSYQPLKWLTVSLEASTLTRDSDLSGFSYDRNRILLKVMAVY
ncbi:MAG: outer membrane beta-barrel protein [Thermodesulfobacteriota bacterium]